ncbi:SGNH/GDSL hydrolase family protein [Micromonospora sp. KC721]|uniref:SGNH/GDSL hydrolase family protein n=1 Tax=Micromonospora sp. KC721 TaxID=2530380 RepID=UPI00104630F8|nr:SGNH/GDSL hydrolase family protein [Micromonospora sp. KC721]TDB77000.1 GDSL family lipase [Micromonospora sp. KC721]
MTVQVPRGGRVLFIGDSITDADRDRTDGADLGHGYAMMAAAWFTAAQPAHRVTFLNRGIGGDRVRDLRARWDDDCLALAPQVVSVLIGINDTWRRYDHDDPTGVEEFERDYRHVLTVTRDRLDAALILMEPFLIPLDDKQRAWREDLDPKVEVVRRLAADFDATLVAVDAAFAAADTDDRVWTDDGVHLTPSGHALLAQHWLRAIVPDTTATA